MQPKLLYAVFIQQYQALGYRAKHIVMFRITAASYCMYYIVKIHRNNSNAWKYVGACISRTDAGCTDAVG